MLNAKNVLGRFRSLRTRTGPVTPVNRLRMISKKSVNASTSTSSTSFIPRLIITDQPGFAADIARMLRLTTLDKNVDRGYFGDLNSNRDIVSWCYPNTFHIVDPVVVPKNWKLNQLPFFPGLDAVEPSSPAAVESLREIVEMMRMAETVICAMEPTNDGQLLFQDLLNYARNQLNLHIPESKVFRIWPRVRNRESIRLALKNPLPNEQFKNLAKSAHARRYIDWSAQYNYSKLYTLLYSRHSAQIFQLGRIPLLLLKQVAERYLERREFKPKVSYEIHLDCLVQGHAVAFKWTKDTSNLVPYETPATDSASAVSPNVETEATTIDRPQPFLKKGSRHNYADSKAEAKQISEGVESTSTIVATQTENIHQPPPLLYNLTSLQREAYERYSIPGSATHIAVQALYEKFGFISNPNTSSHQVPIEQAKSIESTFLYFSSRRKYAEFTTNNALAARIAAKDPRVFSLNMPANKTHAIIPVISSLSTAKRDASMTPTMSIIFDMIVRRFLATMMPDMVHSVITVTLENADKYYFEAKAATMKTEGWKSVGSLPKAKAPFNPGPSNFPSGYIPSTTIEEDEAFLEDIIEQKALYKTLSQLRMGDELKGVIPAAVVPKESSPPPLYTQSRIMALMEDKAALVNNELKYEAGLGTPESRADILTRLMSAKWFRTRQDRYIEPTRKGILLTKLIQDDAITEPLHSHSWDHTLSLIADGKGSSTNALIKRFKSVVEPDIGKHIISGEPGVDAPHLDVAYDLIFYHTNPPAARLLNEAPLLASTRCPKCNSKGHLKQGPSAYFCAAPKCNFTMPQIIDQHLLSSDEAKTLLQRKPTQTISGFIDSLGDTYDATLVLQPPHFGVKINDKMITKKADSKPSKGSDNPLAMRRRRSLEDSLGSSRIVSVLSGPGRPMRGTSVVKVPKPPKPRGRPRLSEEVMAERIKTKVDHQITKSIAKQAQLERERQIRENPVQAPAIRIDAAGNPIKRIGRPRVGEFVPKKPSYPSKGRPKLTSEEIKRRKALKKPVGRPTLASLLKRQLEKATNPRKKKQK